MTVRMNMAQRPDSLVPVYSDHGPTRGLDAREVAMSFSRAGLRSLDKWVFTDGSATSSLIRFARQGDVPPWAGANAMLDSSFSPPPPIAAEVRIPLVCANLHAGSATFQLELSDVAAKLARVWADSVLAPLTLRRTTFGRAVAIGFGFLVDTGGHLLRGSWLPEPSAPADSWDRVAIAERESALLLSRLEAGTG